MAFVTKPEDPPHPPLYEKICSIQILTNHKNDLNYFKHSGNPRIRGNLSCLSACIDVLCTGTQLHFCAYRVFAEEMLAVARSLSRPDTPTECIVVSRDSLQETAVSALECLDSTDWTKQIKVIRQSLLLNCTLHTATVVLVPVRKLQVTLVCKLGVKHVK